MTGLERKKELTDRIWQHSQARSLGKMLLLALAEHADEDGFCYPSLETLGEMIGLEGKSKSIQKNTQHHLAPLIKSKELISWKQQGKRGGRGFTNIYLITVGLTDEEVKERVQRRFNLFDDEVDPAITQEGETYLRLCVGRKIAADKLETTRGQKGGKIIPLDEQKPPKITPHSLPKGDEFTPHNPEDEQKPPKIGGRTKESLIQESNPIKPSNRERESRALKKPEDILAEHKPLALRLIALCGYKSPKFVVNGKMKECAAAITQLVEWDATMALLDEFDRYWWGDTSPTFKQVVEYWGKFLVERQDKPAKQKASSNGHHRTKDNPAQYQSGQAQGLSGVSAQISAAIKAKSRGSGPGT